MGRTHVNDKFHFTPGEEADVMRLFAQFRKRNVSPVAVVAQHSDGHFCTLLNGDYDALTASIVGNLIVAACTEAESIVADKR